MREAPVEVEVLYFEGCPHVAATLALVRDVAAELDVGTALRERAVADEAEAERLRFPGSPTVRVDGADVEPDAAGGSGFGLGCRLYRGSGIPPREWIATALGAAASKEERRVP